MIEIVPTVKFYDYEAKYAPGGSEAPAARGNFPSDVYEEVPKTGACRASGARLPRRHARGFPLRRRARALQGLACLEVNTQPGMTETSLVPELAAHAGMTFEELVRWMIEDASLNR